MRNNEINKLNNQEISKQVENSIELLILYRSIYIIKQKFSLFKERIKNIYNKYNIYNSNLKFKTNITIYQINISDFAQVTDEVLQDLNLLLIKYINPKDIFISKVLIEKKREETKKIIKEILNWLLNENNNGNDLIKNYNIKFFNKKIKPYIEEDIDYENFENMINGIKEDNNVNNMDKDIHKNLSNYEYKILTEYDRKGNIINKYKTKLLEENGEIDEDGITEVIDIKNENKYLKNNNKIVNKELSIKMSNLSNSKNSLKKNDNSCNFILIESLPLILADFLQSHMNNAIIESEDELGKELKLLFDNEIMKRMNEYKNILGDKSILSNIDKNVYINKEEKNDKEFESAMDEYKTVKENLEIYRGILETKKKSGENYDYIEKMIEKLLAKEIWLEHRIKFLLEKKKNSDINFDNNYNISINTNRNFTRDNLENITTNNNIYTQRNDHSLNISKKILGDINSNQNNRRLNESNSNSNMLNSANLNEKNISIITNNNTNTNTSSTQSNPRILNILKEIFIHYSQIHLNVKKTRLFSHLEEKKMHLDLHEFSKFCSDFNIPIKRQKLVEIFKKSVQNLQLMTFKEFNNAVIELANATHESKKKKLAEKISHKKFELNSVILEEKQKKEEKKLKRLLYNDSNIDINVENGGKRSSKNRSPSGYAYIRNLKSEKKNIFTEISNNKINYNKENKKSYQEIINDFYEFLGLNNPQEYRSKMREYNNISPMKNNGNLYLSKDGNKSISSTEKSLNRSKSFIHEDLEKILIKKNERLKKELIDKEKIKNNLFQEKVKLFNINNKRLKITVDRKSKKKTYLELMKEQQEEKSEIISMHNHQKNILQNKMKERELKRIKEKEREKQIIKLISKNLSKEDSKEQLPLNEISEIKKVKDEEYEKKNDKNQIWWSKLENYNIEDLGMNDQEKDLFVSSGLISDDKNSLENKDNINNIEQNNNNNNNDNNSIGVLMSDNSLIKSNSRGDLEINNNRINNDETKKIQEIKLPPIKSSKLIEKKEKEKNNKKKPVEIFKTSQNNKNRMRGINKNK